MLPHCRWPDNPILLGGSDLNGTVFLSEALQRNAKREARLSNISDLFPLGWDPEMVGDSPLHSEWHFKMACRPRLQQV